jgi:glycosyltransferase involved in cell wall biosynthesis
MYVGRPLPHKNLGRLIDAFALLKQTHPDLKLVLAGKRDSLFELHEKETARKGVKNVIFTGFVSEGELRWLYENTAAYVFPTLSEGFGLPGLEAALAGAPIVASNVSCIPEVYGKGALYFDPLDITDMAAKIAKVLDDKDYREALAQAGLKQTQKYSWKRMAEQTLSVFQASLDSSSTSTDT